MAQPPAPGTQPTASGTLYIVATPIGNLEDITLRAIRILREVHLIAAEDTRRTAKLLAHYSIRTATTSFHEHNERQKLPTLLARLRAGENIALVSDAGTPVISDPGSHLISAAHREAITVEPVPGPSAVITALAASGFPADSFVFAGFAPSRSHPRKQWLRSLVTEPRTVVFFEAPHRIRATLSEALEIWGDREIVMARELTKRFYELVKRPISVVLRDLVNPKGEITIVVGPFQEMGVPGLQTPTDASLLTEFGHLTNTEAFSRRQAISHLAGHYGISARAVYAAIERAKKLVT